MKACIRQVVVVALLCNLGSYAESQETTRPSNSVSDGTYKSAPRLIRFNGVLIKEDGTPETSAVTLHFAFYTEQYGGLPLWEESQSVNPDSSGKYVVLLGSKSSFGLSESVFSEGAAKWLGITKSGEAERSRLKLVSVPYALQAADTQMLGGLPASTYLTAQSLTEELKRPANRSALQGGFTAPSGSGSTGFLSKWIDGTNSVLGNSVLFDDGTNVGLGTTSPGAKLDVNGNILFSIAPGQAGFAGFNINGDGVFRAGINMPHLLGEGAPTKQGAFFTMDTRSTENALSIWTKLANSSTEFERVTIQSGGNVGIGNTAPAQKLDVGGNVAVNGSLLITSSALNAGFRGFNLSGDGVLRAGVNMPNLLGEADDTRQGAFFTMDTRAGQSVLAVFTKSPGSSVETERFTVQSTGNVGIDNPAPTVALDVSGVVRAANGFKFPDGSIQTSAASACATNCTIADTSVARTNVSNIFSLSQTVSGSSSTPLLTVQQAGTGAAVVAMGTTLGVSGQASSSAGAGVKGQSLNAGGIAGLFDNSQGGTIISGQVNGVEKFRVDGSGNVRAASYKDMNGNAIPLAGDGSAVTNINASNLTAGTIASNLLPPIPTSSLTGMISFTSLPVGSVASTVAAGNDPRLSDARPPLAGSSFYIQNGPAAPQTASVNITGSVQSASLSASGSVKASSFSGNGSSLTGLSQILQATSDPACNQSLVGSVYFNTSTRSMRYCNGTQFIGFAPQPYSSGPQYCGTTVTSTNGIINFNTSQGYRAAKQMCESTCSSPEAHMCVSAELVRTAQLNTKNGPTALSWYSDGVSDCLGWTTTGGNGSTWYLYYPEGPVSCSTSLPVACCL